MTKASQIVESILAEIGSGALARGDRVDSERRLTRRFGVSLGTAQRALADLQRMGVLVREHGRGTFVTRAEETVPDARFIKFRTASGAALPMRTKILSVGPRKTVGATRDFFGGDHANCIRIVRRLDIGGQFDLISEFFLLQVDFDRLLAQGKDTLEGNIREHLTGAIAMPTLRIEQTLAFSALPNSVTRLLKFDGATEGFTMEMRAYTLQDRPLYLQSVFGKHFGGATLVIER